MSTQSDIRYEHLRLVPQVEESNTPSNQAPKQAGKPPVDITQFPPISAELVEALDALFPERSASLNDSHTHLMFVGGQRSVVRWLIAEHQAQLKGAS